MNKIYFVFKNSPKILIKNKRCEEMHAGKSMQGQWIKKKYHKSNRSKLKSFKVDDSSSSKFKRLVENLTYRQNFQQNIFMNISKINIREFNAYGLFGDCC